MSLSNPKGFFDALRAGLLGPKIEPNEVEGCNAILSACNGWPVSWAAYALATAMHETAHTMQPVKEYGGANYFRRMYAIEGANPALAKRLGNTVPGDGVKFAGRGFVQITGRSNYTKAQAETHWPLVDQPDLAMRQDIAAAILRWGMGEGAFTGKSLMTYLPTTGPATLEQFKAARRIINGVDKADLIAGYALQFQDALKAGGWS